MNAAITNNLSERLVELGGIAPQRLCVNPAPGTATNEDLARYNETHSPLCELIDSTLVEKAVGYESSSRQRRIAFVQPKQDSSLVAILIR